MTDALYGLNKAQTIALQGVAERAEFLEKKLKEIEQNMKTDEETEIIMLEIYKTLLGAYTNCASIIFNAIPEDGE